ncbi:hypothetical protein ACIQXF_04970 [Lysinibacillus sp. NPDC097231]|uniref:hypothetical protein n=1 Tax=Lysinibacillus sp. NPDC097231 TaxID=3364142 RepID=UPI00380C12DD
MRAQFKIRTQLRQGEIDWYCLADAQIKAHKFDDASKSIQKGIALAKKLLMQEVVQDFNDLKERFNTEICS